MLADMATAIDASRLMTWEAAARCDAGKPVYVVGVPWQS